jgi:hypothetical protein
MIRLAWRQFRSQAAIAIAGLLVVAIALAITGPQLVHLYNTTVAGCKAQGDCQTATSAFVSNDTFLQNGLDVLIFVLPALIGIFWGAPLVAREFETGTVRLAWTQSVTRTRWLAAKLGVVGLSSIAVAGLLSLMVTWWFSRIDRVNANRFVATVFDARDIVPIGYAAFAFALGVTAGVLIRRTLPAMATTLVGFVAARLAMTHWIRPHLIAPAQTAAALSSATRLGFEGSPSGAVAFVAGTPSFPNAWSISSRIVDRAGHAPTTQGLHTFLSKVCPNIAAPPKLRGGGPTAGNPAAFQECIARLSAKFHLAVSYQPASRYWTFQWLELAIYFAAALILAGVCFWSIRRRLC